MAMSENESGQEAVLTSASAPPPQTGTGEGPTDGPVSSSSPPKEALPSDNHELQLFPEDDLIAQRVENSGRGTDVFLSSSESAFASASTAVAVERKQVLLAQARADRLDWIRKVPLPYEQEGQSDASSTSETAFNQLWDSDPRLAQFKNSHVLQASPAALQVLSHLYGLASTTGAAGSKNEQVIGPISKRVGDIIDHVNEMDGEQDGKLAVPTAEQIRSQALAAEDGNTLLSSYHGLVSKLADPAAAVLVQGMRSFCGKVQNEAPDTLPSKLQGYLRVTSEHLKDYGPWNSNTETSEEDRRSLESFLYGQMKKHLEDVYWTKEQQEEEQQWQARLDSLQFVNDKHLEISCLAESDIDNSEIFNEPVQALLSMGTYFSPFEKLQRILKVYHSVNSALTRVLNQSNHSEPKKLPSADDVLPSIILTVLLSRPSRLLWNLQFIEDFAPAEYLRGEAGYAYTNLYGAVQFLKDIDLDSESPVSLKISKEEFQNCLQSSRNVMDAKLSRQSTLGAAVDVDSDTSFLGMATEISVSSVRHARLQGHTVDLDWARSCLTKATETTAKQTHNHNKSIPSEDSDLLPSGFSRSYTFLNSRPEDIRLSDLPQLLTEYNMLVHTTEVLVGEKISHAKADKKAELAAKQKEVYEAAKQIDPSLLPDN